MLQKIKGYHLMVVLGLLGKYAQMDWDFAQRSGSRTPPSLRGSIH